MVRGDFRADPREIIRAHRATYVSAGTGKRRGRDILVFEAVPVAGAGLIAYFGVRLSALASGSLLMVSGLLSVFLFSVVVQLWARSMNLADSRPESGPVTSGYALDLGDLAANAACAALVCVVAAVIFLVADISHGWMLRISSAVGLALAAHLALVLLMVINRVSAMTQAELARARAEGGRPSLPGWRRPLHDPATDSTAPRYPSAGALSPRLARPAPAVSRRGTP